MTRISTSNLLALSLVLAAVSTNPALAQQGAPPYTTNNAQSACVQFGSCSTAGGNGVVTATQNGPVTKPAGTPALATYTTLDSSFLSSLAAAGASAAYTGGSTFLQDVYVYIPTCSYDTHSVYHCNTIRWKLH
ncbi:hypothetical protein [Sporisorium scitamineum]|uniref:Uncharacterized protein n=1 Tax=Sporisorium scitamineum TaxID=49012 RepID=A0A0F7RY29_9BASI|nr:hypothetical protein [Sporisorium scitamineum]